MGRIFIITYIFYHKIVILSRAAPLYFIKSSITKTVTELSTATVKRPLPKYARSIATTSAARADIGVCVALSIAGKVITAKVTYGT